MTQDQHRSPLAPGEIRTHTVGQRTFRVMHVAGGSFTQASFTQASFAQPGGVLCTDRFADAAVRAYADAIEQAESDEIDALDDADGPSFTASGAFVPSTPNVIEQERAALVGGGVRQCLRSFMPDHEGHTDGITGPCHLSPPCPRDDHPHLAADSMECFEVPEVVEALPEGAITAGVGGTCLRMDGEHATHGYARYGEGCAPGADPMTDENLPMGASRTLVTGETSAAPGLAGDVAALRVQFENLLRDCGVPRASALAVFDRIAAQMPQRATDRNGWPLKMCVACHHITAETRAACRSCGERESRQLYTLGGE